MSDSCESPYDLQPDKVWERTVSDSDKRVFYQGSEGPADPGSAQTRMLDSASDAGGDVLGIQLSSGVRFNWQHLV